MQGPVALGIAFLGMLCVCRVHVDAMTRTYYLAAVEVDWDYAPKGNVVNDDIQMSNEFLLRGQERVGSIYRKVVYRLYTDARFTEQVRPDAAQGLLGPILRAETGDTLNVVFKNMAVQANRNFSVHPHGVQYNKNAEGALYVDQTTGSDKADDGVGPGRVFTYVWRVRPTFGPTAGDGPCLPWLYHSHVMPTRDVDTGLVGLLLTCKAGTLQKTGPRRGQRGDVAKEFALYLDTADENNSWLLQNNLNRCGNPAACRQLSQSQNADFVRSNKMSHINGRVYGNLEGLEVSQGERVAFYLFSINRGVTSVQFSGQVLNVNNHIVDSIILFPATTATAITTPSFCGNWLIASRNVDTFPAGQQAYLRVTQARHWEDHGRIRRGADQNNLPEVMPDPELGGLSSAYARGGHHLLKLHWTRRYYLAIEKYIWDYGPSGQDLFNGVPLTQPGSASAPYFTQGPQRIGGRYIKARYVEYTDQTFRVRKAPDDTTEHLGMLGPVIMAEVGETVEVRVKNMADRPYSFFPHGVLFTKENEGFVYRNPDTNQTEGQMVLPGEVGVYRFRVPLLAPDDLPCVTHTYHSAVDLVRDINTGLVGPLLVCSRGQLSQQITLPWKNPFIRRPPHQSTWFQKHLHLFLNFFTVDENVSWYLLENIANFTSAPQSVNVLDSNFSTANRRHAINGRMFSNLEGLNVCLYENVAWHLFGVGGEFDMHGVNFQGQTLDLTGKHISSEVIIPGSALTMTSTPDSKGNWTVSCRTTFHFSTGMTATYRVQDCGANPEPKPPRGVTRRYYIAAQELVWDYAPLKRDSVTGENFTDDSQHGYLYVKDDDLFIGSSYKKALYIEYTDSTFRTRKVRGSREQHLGFLGPVIKAEVNDVIEVIFFNNASRPYSMQPQGVRYENANQNSVPPGSTYTYTWEVPSRAGPGPNDPSCVAWMYFSAVNFVRDTNSGLVGPLLVCKPSTLTSGGSSRPADRRDVDREFWMLYTVMDENQSWYLRENVQTFAPNRTLDRLTEADFMESNRMNAINGRIFGNVDGLVMHEGDVVAWYLLGLGSSLDYHPVHFHGQTFTYLSDRLHRGDVMEVFPTTSAAVQMLCDNPGSWIVHCHFANHVAAGMEAVYTVLPRPYRY